MYQNYIKNILDRIFALIVLIILSPIYIIIALISKIIEPKGKVIFSQYRSGKDRKPFMCYKFRSMTMDAPKNESTYELKNAHNYITPFGSFLRRTSLDELPQIFNILKGDMSFVGPRPVILKETKLLDLREEKGACKVKPGITGLSQISGRDNLGPRKKAETDAIYANNVCFRNDLKIILLTIPNVLFSKGITEGEQDIDDFEI
ncbi:MAG: sugar transferase [Tissierellia bacterium]|nr:sugar transferase [Tissierellia bacterium]